MIAIRILPQLITTSKTYKTHPKGRFYIA